MDAMIRIRTDCHGVLLIACTFEALPGLAAIQRSAPHLRIEGRREADSGPFLVPLWELDLSRRSLQDLNFGAGSISSILAQHYDADGRLTE